MIKTIAGISLPLVMIISAPSTFAQDSTASDMAGGVAGRTFRVDDTGTVVLDPYLEMKWQPALSSSGSRIVSATTKVSAQLNLTAWIGKAARIYMTLPRNAGPTIRATWSTGGTLLPGRLLSGDRALVYAGPIRSGLLRDLIDLTLEVDSTRLVQPQALAFGFEIEVQQ